MKCYTVNEFDSFHQLEFPLFFPPSFSFALFSVSTMSHPSTAGSGRPHGKSSRRRPKAIRRKFLENMKHIQLFYMCSLRPQKLHLPLLFLYVRVLMFVRFQARCFSKVILIVQRNLQSVRRNHTWNYMFYIDLGDGLIK